MFKHVPIGIRLFIESKGIGTRGRGQAIEYKLLPILIICIWDGDEGVDLGQLWNLE